ncbi:MAG: flagellar basal body rod protein FlgF [Pseudomonadales bacterium]|nr:flagellar basal body rod protein FlgF [Pseudomonadales bacterium]MCP5184727.1 flagellar basal body rod protein FlgF [Pseudomonadales bacterium]
MDRLLYIATVGAAQIERAQTVHANNLANVNSNAFRADLARAESRWVEGQGHPARAYGVSQPEHVDMTPGSKIQTGRVLDVAIADNGLLTLQTPDGGEAYSRNGALQIDAFGRLTAANGLPVMGDGGPIAIPPYTNLHIGEDGTISIQPEGQAPETLVEVGRIKLVHPDPADLVKDTMGNLVRSDGNPEAPDASVRVESGYLETSNVNAVQELTSILSLARQFELEVRMVKVAEGNDEAATRLLQIG